MKKIIMRVSPTGEIRIETRGFVGKSCKDASKFLEDTLGEKTAETFTVAYRQTDTGTGTSQSTGA